MVLVATDSASSMFAARVNKRILASRLFHCPAETVGAWQSEADNSLHEGFGRLPIVRVPGLQVIEPHLFEDEGKGNLERLLREEDAADRLPLKILNLTGGFKGLVPIVVSLAWFLGWEPVYLYEETDALLYCPRPKWMEPKKEYRGPIAPTKVGFGPLPG